MPQTNMRERAGLCNGSTKDMLTDVMTDSEKSIRTPQTLFMIGSVIVSFTAVTHGRSAAVETQLMSACMLVTMLAVTTSASRVTLGTEP